MRSLRRRLRGARSQRQHGRLVGDAVSADPGSILAAEGVPVDSDATYLMKAVQYMIWPYDKGRLVGEDVWEYDEASREHNPYTA